MPSWSLLLIPCVVRVARTSLSNCAKPARMVSMSLPSGLAPIGSVTDRTFTPYFPNEKHIYFPFVVMTEVDQLDKLSTICEFRRFTAFDKNLENFDLVGACIITTRGFLRF